MRILVVRPGPHFSVDDVRRGYVNAFKNLGCTVADFNLDDRLNVFSSVYVKKNKRWKPAFDADAAVKLAVDTLQTALYQYWPDVVIVVSGFYLKNEILELIRSRKHKLVLLATESPYEDFRQIEKAPFYDVCFINDPTNIDLYRKSNPQTYYMPHSYDPELHCPGPVNPEMASDFYFCGTGYPSRIDFFEQMDLSKLNVKLGGNWGGLSAGSPLLKNLVHPIEWCMDNVESTEFSQSTKSSINIYRREAERPELENGWAMGPREVELAATGTFFLRDPRPEGDEILNMLPTFSSPGDASEKLRWWLKHDEQRHFAIDRASAAVADRTFENNAKRLLDQI